MTSDLTVVDITTRAGLPDAHVRVMQALHQLGEIVPTSRWCLIGGLMVEVLLASRDGMMLRPTYDGDIVGDVVADRSALRKLAHALLDLGFDEKPTGWDGDIGVRFRHPVSHVYIDVLMPENSSRLRNVLPARPQKRSLEAPGTDYAIVTATDFAVTFAADHQPLAVRVPSVCGALYAKASAWKRIKNASDPNKHLQDAAALLTVATLQELTAAPKAFTKRLVWLDEELTDANSVGWQYVEALSRRDAIARLAAAVTTI